MNTTPMHELYLAAIVTRSLILPLTARAAAPGKPWMPAVWAGQMVGALGGLLVIFSRFIQRGGSR